MKRRVFSESFKKEAVALVKEHQRPASQAAKELGISESALRRWVEAHEVASGDKPGLTVQEKAEIRDLRREVATLRMEREMLKKAASFFAKESR